MRKSTRSSCCSSAPSVGGVGQSMTARVLAFSNLTKHNLKHWPGVFSMVVAECVFIKVALEMLSAHGVIDPPDAGLDEPKETLNRIGMNVAIHVDLGCM